MPLCLLHPAVCAANRIYEGQRLKALFRSYLKLNAGESFFPTLQQVGGRGPPGLAPYVPGQVHRGAASLDHRWAASQPHRHHTRQCDSYWQSPHLFSSVAGCRSSRSFLWSLALPEEGLPGIALSDVAAAVDARQCLLTFYI